MTYEIIYGDTGKPDPVQVTVQASNPTVLDVMEQAVIDHGNNYTFTVNYLTSGFALDKLNGAASKEVEPKYDWILYLDGISISSDISLSDITVSSVSTVRWSYEMNQDS